MLNNNRYAKAYRLTYKVKHKHIGKERGYIFEMRFAPLKYFRNWHKKNLPNWKVFLLLELLFQH
jgi:beta-carotene 3-hydroxylase